MVAYSVPGLKSDDADKLVALLQDRLNSLNDRALTPKHVHWNVVGPNFIAFHTMLDSQVDAVRAMVDDIAERVATLGGSPTGTPGGAGRAARLGGLLHRPGRHPAAPRRARRGVHRDHRDQPGRDRDHRGPGPVTQDMLIGQGHQLEQFHWFVRAHLETPEGR